MRIRASVVLAVIVALGGSAAAVPRAGAVGPAEPVPLQVGLSFNNLEAVPIWLGIDQHIFERYGIKVDLVTIRGGTQTMAAMASGKLPLAFPAGATIVQPVLKGIPITLVAGLVTVMPYDFLVSADIRTPAQLTGARGGISGFGSADYYAQLYALSRLHVDAQRVVWLQIGTETDRLQALKTKQIQFTALTTGLDAAALSAGFRPLLKLYETNQPYQHVGVAVYKPWAATHRAELVAFLKGLIASIVYWKNPAHEQQALAAATRHLHVPAEILKPGLDLYRDKMMQTYPLVSRVGMEFILKFQKVTRPATDFYDNSYVEALKREQFAATVRR